MDELKGFDNEQHKRESLATMEFNDRILNWLNTWIGTIWLVWGSILTALLLRCVIFDRKKLTPEQIARRRREQEILWRIETEIKDRRKKERKKNLNAAQNVRTNDIKK